MPQLASATQIAKTPLPIGRRCAADCTCNGHNPAGLAAVDLAMDGSLCSGDALATTDGLVTYSGIRVGNDQNPDFTPVASSLG